MRSVSAIGDFSRAEKNKPPASVSPTKWSSRGNVRTSATDRIKPDDVLPAEIRDRSRHRRLAARPNANFLRKFRRDVLRCRLAHQL